VATPALSVVVVTLLASAGCAPSLLVPLQPPPDFTCPDGRPLRVLVNERCRYGVCGFSCAPGRWVD
jgi:hypothetical protein